MGMWLLQGCRKQWHATDYASLVALAKPDPDLTSLIDPDHASFLHPGEHDVRDRRVLPAPRTSRSHRVRRAYVQTIFESLALKYRYVLDCLSQLTGHVYTGPFGSLGAAHAIPFSTSTSPMRPAAGFSAGPVEATALGNIVMQMVASGAVDSIAARPRDRRSIVSCQLSSSREDTGAWDDAYTVSGSTCSR